MQFLTNWMPPAEECALSSKYGGLTLSVSLVITRGVRIGFNDIVIVRVEKTLAVKKNTSAFVLTPVLMENAPTAE